MKEIWIGQCPVGPVHPPFLIAEISANHRGSLERALELVDAAKSAGADAIKLQTYTSDTITLDVRGGDFLISDPESLWSGRNLYDLYQEAHTPWEWHGPLFARARELGLVAFSTSFDESAVDFLEDLKVPCHKIASFEIVDHPLIAHAARTGKPLIISTGTATFIEIAEAVEVARRAGCRSLLLLKCTSGYPTPPSDCNLRAIPHLQESFQVPVGLSDHTLSLGVPVASVALGACLIEKHFTLSRAEGGVDCAFSLEPHEFKQLVQESRVAWEGLGGIRYGDMASEESNRWQFRPSLYFTCNVKAGQVVEAHHIRSVRPGRGLPVKEGSKVIGLQLKRDVSKGTAVSWEIFKPERPNTDPLGQGL